MFRRKKGAVLSYKIVGSTGNTGNILKPGQSFEKTFTICNTAALNSKDKGRVVRLVQADGVPLLKQLFFLWPVPGKTMTVCTLPIFFFILFFLFFFFFSFLWI